MWFFHFNLNLMFRDYLLNYATKEKGNELFEVQDLVGCEINSVLKAEGLSNCN